MPLKINGATNGSVTLAAPATGSDVTLTLPSSTGTVQIVPGSWTSYTPTLTNLTVGTGGTNVAKYLAIGTLVHFYGVITLGTGFSIGDARIGLPGTAASNSAINMNAYAHDVGTNYYILYADQSSPSFTTSVRIGAVVASGSYGSFGLLSSTVPFTWVAGDQIFFSGFYEAV